MKNKFRVSEIHFKLNLLKIIGDLLDPLNNTGWREVNFENAKEFYEL